MSTDLSSTGTDLSGRAGFDPSFLGVPVVLPVPTDAGVPTVLLGYTHFSVLMRPDRRLAAVTGVGIDGATLQEVERADDWQLDPRLPADQQTGEVVYARNDLDRGHLVRRLDPVWGTPTAAEQANLDTFFFTNAAPQAAVFNQGRALWLGLEDYLLDNAATFDRRLVVFTGCVLDPDDPSYRGVQIPLRFFKVAVFLDDTDLAATGYVLDQTPLVQDLPTTLAAADPPPLGPFRTFQVPIATLTGLDLTALAAADRAPVPAPTPSGGPRHSCSPPTTSVGNVSTSPDRDTSRARSPRAAPVGSAHARTADKPAVPSGLSVDPGTGRQTHWPG